MNWIAVAIYAYLLISMEIVLDKFLLSSKKVSHPAIYAFYSGILSLFVIVFMPFGFHWVGLEQGVTSLLFGAIFIYGILSLFYAIQKNEASRVMPVVGAIIPITTYFTYDFFWGDKLTPYQLLGVALLIAGGLFISFDLPLKIKSRKFFSGFSYAVLAGILIALALDAFKVLYKEDNFLNVFIWTRFGLAAGALSLLIVPYGRKIILGSFASYKENKKDNQKTGVLFVVNKSLGGIGSIMLNYAIALGSVTIVNALVSIEYVFILLLGLVLSVRYPSIFQEKWSLGHLVQKIAAIAVITVGVTLVSVNSHALKNIAEIIR